MPDYNIYIHAVNGTTNENPTVPWSQRQKSGSSQTTSQSSDEAGGFDFRGIIKAASVAQNPDSVVSSAVSGVAKAIPWVAAAYAVAKTCVKIYEISLDFKTLKSGDYAEQIKWNDTKRLVSNVLTPFSTTLNSIKTTEQWRIENYRREGHRELLGDSVINSYTGRGV